MQGGALVSEDGVYRYHLWRRWGENGDWASLLFVMLNPSTADESTDDPTIRRCIGFARREGYSGIDVLNLYALRCTRPVHLLDHPDPEGPGNLDTWDTVLDNHCGRVVAAWGDSAPTLAPPSQALLGYAAASESDWWCLGHTAAGSPRHPLYIPAAQPLVALGRHALSPNRRSVEA